MGSPRISGSWKSALLTVLVALAVASLVVESCAPNGAVLREQADRHPTRSIHYWGVEWLRKPLVERIAPAPRELIDKIRIDNRLHGFAEKPVAAETSPEFETALQRIVGILSQATRNLAEERIIGLFLVRGLGGTGYTEAILDETGKEAFAVIVLDREILLKKTANDWATWKENSFFKPMPTQGIDLTVRIEEEKNDSVENAIVYILMHEIGHALGMASGVHPSWNGEATVSEAYPFTRFSWRMNKNQTESLAEDAFPERKTLRAYAFDHASLSLDQATYIYRQLARTDFPTLYAAVSVWEDFAESFANYLHVVRQQRPYEIRIRNVTQDSFLLPPCWDEGRCKAKRTFMEKWMGDPAQ